MMQVGRQMESIPSVSEQLELQAAGVRHRQDQPTVLADPSPQLFQRRELLVEMLQDHPADHDNEGGIRIAGGLYRDIADLVPGLGSLQIDRTPCRAHVSRTR